MDTGTPGNGEGPAGTPPLGDAHPDASTAPRPVVPAAHHHEGGAGPSVSAPGHHVDVEPVGARRRRTLVTVAAATVGVLVLGTAGAMALSRAESTPAAATPTGAASVPGPGGVGLTPAAAEPADATDTANPPPLPPSRDTLVLGDSLGLAVYPWLADLLPDRYVSYQAEVGRSTPATRKRLEQLTTVPPVVIVSSGTNDGVANIFEESARRILDDLGPQRCVVWVDVVRPDRVGDSQETMNAALDRAVSGRANVRILRWSALVEEHPEWMSGDGIHPNEAGSQGRAQAYADAARGCSALDPRAPRAKRQYLPQSAFWGPVSGQYRSPTSGSGGSGTTSRTATGTSTTSTSGSASTTSSPSSSPTPEPTPTEATPTSSSAPPPSTSAPETSGAASPSGSA